MTATYNATTNCLEEQPGIMRPRRPFAANYANQNAFDFDLADYRMDMIAYNKAVSECRTIPCSPECRGLWKVGQEIVEGRDYEVREVKHIHRPAETVSYVMTAFPLPVKSDDDLWDDVLTKIHMKALAYVSVGGHPHPGLPNHDPWHKEMIDELKKHYSLTKR